MEIIRSTPITESMFISSNLLEDDHAEYSASVTYGIGDKVIMVSTHRIYESQITANIGNNPPDNLEAEAPAVAPWKDIGATNKWRAFDLVVGNQATHASVLVYELKPGMINSISLQNVDGVEATFTMDDPDDGVVFNKTIKLISTANVKDIYDWFFEPILFIDTCVEWDLPIYPDATLTISINNGDSPVSCGEIVVGMQMNTGKTRGTPSVSIHDYSVKTTDDAGAYTIEERAFSKEISCDVRIENQYQDHIFSTLVRYRSTPTVWVVVEGYASMIAFGFFSDFTMSLPEAKSTMCAIEIISLT